MLCVLFESQITPDHARYHWITKFWEENIFRGDSCLFRKYKKNSKGLENAQAQQFCGFEKYLFYIAFTQTCIFLSMLFHNTGCVFKMSSMWIFPKYLQPPFFPAKF